jgi:hypothetical protein
MAKLVAVGNMVLTNLLSHMDNAQLHEKITQSISLCIFMYCSRVTIAYMLLVILHILRHISFLISRFQLVGGK